MSIKLVAIDMDGTLVNSQRQVTEGVIAAVAEARAKGVKIVLCTGRPFPGVEPELELLGINGEEDYVITYNGSLVQNVHTREVLFSANLTKADYLDINYMAQKLDVHLHVSADDAIYTANRDISPYTVHESFLVHMPVKYRTPEEMLQLDLNMIKMMIIDDEPILDAAIAKLPADFKEKYNTVKSAPFYLEVLNKEASKGVALKALAEHLGLAVDEVMAIGDNENDLSMLEYAGTAVAMQNAIPLVKENCDHITEMTNDEDGVAEALRKFV